MNICGGAVTADFLKNAMHLGGEGESFEKTQNQKQANHLQTNGSAREKKVF